VSHGHFLRSLCEYAGVHIGYDYVVSCAYNIALYGQIWLHMCYMYIYASVSDLVARIHLSGLMEGSRIV
jgi:hypothetical protein